ncbi:MAG: histidine ammonia-lyase [Burkholderiaceae bacterium]
MLDPGHVRLDQWSAIERGVVQVRLADPAWAAIDRAGDAVGRLVAAGRVVYGVNTGFGKLAQTIVPAPRLAELQRNLVLSHSVGTGPPLPPGVVRLVLASKAVSLARGHAGVRREVVAALLALLNADVLPVIPAQGSVGASGDLAPLAHLACVLIGQGQATIAGQAVDAARALRHAGLAALELGPKEGLALLNGTQVSTALALSALFDAERVFAAGLTASALSLEAIKGSVRPLDPRIHAARGQPGQIAVAAALRALLADSAIVGSHQSCGRVQDPYSIRCVPQVMGACLDAIAHAARVLGIEANAASDNPLIFADEPIDVLSGGNFHAEPVAFAADLLALAIAEIGAIAERRIALLIDADLSGLPPFLVRDGGVNSGFMIAHVTAAALASENKSLAHPASVDSLPTSANQEDHVSMATFAARRLHDMVRNTAVIVGIEAMAAAQGIEFHRPLRSSAAVEAELASVRERVAFLDRDRLLAPDVEAMRAWALRDAWPAPIRALLPSASGAAPIDNLSGRP